LGSARHPIRHRPRGDFSMFGSRRLHHRSLAGRGRRVLFARFNFKSVDVPKVVLTKAIFVLVKFLFVALIKTLRLSNGSDHLHRDHGWGIGKSEVVFDRWCTACGAGPQNESEAAAGGAFFLPPRSRERTTKGAANHNE